ncbi:MAG TPA: ABC transporter permease, partial [Microbacterium sp.]|nr:ABC transporter permease [Microbacterium sp.]
MTAVTLDAEPRTVAVVSWKTPVIFTVVTVLFALLPLFVPRAGDSTFRLTAGGEILALPNVVVPGTATAWVAVFLAAAVTTIAWWLAATRRTVPLWLTAIF